MPNRTISLCDVSDSIRKTLTDQGVNFSHWVRMQLLANAQQALDPVEFVKPNPPRNYMCKHCLGEHWTADCPSMEDSQ